MKIKTVMIDNNGTSLVINASDFRHGSDKLWDAGKDEVVAAAPARAVEKDDNTAVNNNVKVSHKGGGRWVVTVNGESVHEGTLEKEDAQALANEY